MRLSKPQTALFGAVMIVVSPVLVPLVALVAAVLYFVMALACVLTLASVKWGDT